MGIFDALTTAVSGLQAQAFGLQNISGNIANASTVGYKGLNTSFEDLIPGSNSPAQQVAGGVIASSQATITTQGTVSSSTVATNIAINGDGFFSVQKPTGIVDNVPTFNGVANYTRSGDFKLDANGNLVNSAGYYLMGQAVDSKTGNVTGNVPQILRFQSSFIPAQSTSTINYAANLPASPTTKNSTGATAGTITALGGLNPAIFTRNPLNVGSPQPLLDASLQGTGVNNNLTVPVPITSATALSGAANTDSLPTATAFANGNSLTVDGTIINFSSSSPTSSGSTSPITISTTDTVGTLLAKIDAITQTTTPSSIDSTGKITLHTGINSNLVITAGAGTATALAGLGFTLAAGTLTVNATPTGTVGTGTVIASDQQNFLNESISGSAVTTYDQTGNPVNLQLRWALTDSAQLGAGHSNTWNLFYESNPNATGSQVQWTNAGTPFTFNSSGTMTSPITPAISISNVAVGSLTLGTVTFNVAQGGQGALTQYANGGAVSINSTSQDGYAAGSLQSVAINNNGLVVGTFSNGQNLDLASVTLSHFNGTNYLQALSGGAYAATLQSGSAIIGASGSIAGSSLEGSNTDIATEFAKLIVTQQAYSADTKIVTTANSMVQDLLNVLR